MFYNQVQIKELRKIYHKGMMIHLYEMKNEDLKNIRGKIEYVDDAGQIHVRWDNGSSLAIIPSIDKFKIID